MRLATIAVVLATALPTLAAVGCRRDKDEFRNPSSPTGQLAFGLGNADADKREDAAKDLRDDGGPPPAAVPHLLMALQHEQNEKAFRQMLITLGASGAPEARPVIDAHLNHPDEDLREAAEDAGKLWAKRTGQMAPRAMPKEVAMLQSPDWKDRQDAADELGDDDGPIPMAVPPLMVAAQRETHPKALGAMLITLGQSGAPEAKPLIDAHVNAVDDDLRRYARKGLKNWLSKNGTVVRRDIGYAMPAPVPQPKPGAPAATAAVAPPPAPTATASAQAVEQGCTQFATVCGTDPFDVNRCKKDLAPMTHAGVQSWAECINASTDPCQKAHESCLKKK